MMTKSKKKRGRIIGIIITVLFLMPIIFLCALICMDILKYKRIEFYYYANKKSFETIVEYFDNLYMENLHEVRFGIDTTCLEFKLKYIDANGEVNYLGETVACANTSFVKELSQLREKYQKKCDYPVFSSIYAYYDEEGKMLLYMQVYNEKLSTEEARSYYLVYIEDGYSGSHSSLAIDSWGTITREPFTANWYTWSKDMPFG